MFKKKVRVVLSRQNLARSFQVNFLAPKDYPNLFLEQALFLLSAISYCIYKNKCINCTRALNKRINDHERETGEVVRPEEYAQFSMQHDGTCYRKSKVSTAASEEFLTEQCARDLLLDASGNPRDEATCVYASTVVADNDSKSVKRGQRAQQEIIGDAVHGVSTHDPDLNHLIKNQSNDMFDAAKKNPALRGQTGLKPLRIKSLSSDMTQIVKDLHNSHFATGMHSQVQFTKRMPYTAQHRF